MPVPTQFAPNVILHPTDFSDSATEALRYALRLARRHDAALHLLHVTPPLGDDPIRGAFEAEVDPERFYEAVEEKADAEMMDLLETVEASDVSVTRVHRRAEAPGSGIVAYADEAEADLVVMGTHGRRGVARVVLGSVAEEVVRTAPCSVLTVRAGHAVHPDDVEDVLVPVDLSRFAEPLIRHGAGVAASFQATMHLLHVVEPLPFPVPLVGAVTLHDLIPDPTDRAERLLKQLAKEAGGLPVRIQTHVVEGHAADAIEDASEELEADLIVVASHGLSDFERILLGSVTTRIVRRASCPVLVMRITEDLAAELEEQAEGAD